MLAELRLIRSHGRVRRLLAALLGFALMFVSGAEPLFADSCDGDAPASVVAAAADHVDSGTAAVWAAGNDERPANSSSGAPVEHAVHLCHCTHVHGGLDQAQYAVETNEVAVAVAAMPALVEAPAGPVGEPPVRPPAVTSVM